MKIAITISRCDTGDDDDAVRVIAAYEAPEIDLEDLRRLTDAARLAIGFKGCGDAQFTVEDLECDE